MQVHLFIAINIVAIWGVVYFQNNPYIQFQIFTILGITYLSGAFMHHFLDKSLTLEVMIEYLLTAALALVILYSLLV